MRSWASIQISPVSCAMYFSLSANCASGRGAKLKTSVSRPSYVARRARARLQILRKVGIASAALPCLPPKLEWLVAL